MSIEQVCGVLLASVAARAGGRAAVVLLRRAAAAGVRAGIAELGRRTHEGESR